ncbi:hypothetical protein E4U56_005558 [Claviceps arundinis]|uniref:Uncharacterized protein n=1 Tax=Claviceps arundinis TaxID=1623583 RepID=A0A9P7SUZ2_9HYPO|nr:hypothetical protein E4U56_005558 [Claviceps arundinis]
MSSTTFPVEAELPRSGIRAALLSVAIVFAIPFAQNIHPRVLEASPSYLYLKFNFVNLKASFETFEQTGSALPDDTVEVLRNDCDGALIEAVNAFIGYS